MDEIQRQYQLAAEAQKESLKNQLQSQKEEALKNALVNKESSIKTLEDTKEQQTKQYDTQKVAANVSNEVAARNFAEYLANRGLSNSGAGVQAEINRSGNLQNRVTGISNTENLMANEIAKKIQEANTNYFKTQEQTGNLYNTNLQSGINQIDSELAKNIAEYLREINTQRLKTASKSSNTPPWDNTEITQQQQSTEQVAQQQKVQQQEANKNSFESILGAALNIKSGAGAKVQKEKMIKNLLLKQFQNGSITEQQGNEIYSQLGYE